MKESYKRRTNKQKLANVLLSCLSWGCAAPDSPDLELKIQKRLKLQYPFDSYRLRSCIDLIEDTEYAIMSFCEYGIEKFTEHENKDLGEIYLRLYGILNAVQQQKLALIELFETLRLKNKKEISIQLSNLKISEIRNVVGAHTINLKDKPIENFNTNFFRITQCSLSAKADNINAVDGFGGLREYNLYESVLEYNSISEIILFDGVMEYMNKIFFNSLSKKNEILSHYEIEELVEFNYRDLYKNEILAKNYQRKIRRNINIHLKKIYGKNWKEKLDERLRELTLEKLLLRKE